MLISNVTIKGVILMAWIKWLLIALGLITLMFVALTSYGSYRWEKSTQALLEKLEATRTPPTTGRYQKTQLDGLPIPVQRYFQTVLTEGQAIVTAVSVSHQGSFNMSEDGEQWKPFTSQQRVITQRPGFVWDASVMMLPGVPVRVHDAYVAGEGLLHPAILGLLTLVKFHGSGDIAQGELMRFVAETPWYPTALLPSQNVRWEAVNDRSANVTMTDGILSITLRFRFNDQGLIESGLAQARGRTIGKTIEMTPWEGRWSNYADHSGMRVPMTGEVAWLTPQGRKPYWRGSVQSLTYEFSQ
jgi:hypothetical protein